MAPRITQAPDPNGIVAGDTSLLHGNGTLLSGQNLTRGAVIGQVTASGKLKLSVAAATDGSEKPIAVLAEDCNASAGDASCLFYRTGEFALEKCTLGAGHTIATVNQAFLADGRSLALRSIGAAFAT